jgi:hypothetical protein
MALPFAVSADCAGLKAQLMPDGTPEQASVTCPAKPPVEFSVAAKLEELPAAITAEPGEMDPVIPPTVTCRSCVWAIEPLAALTVKLSLPWANVGGVVTVSVAGEPEAFGVMVEELKAHATPGGKFVQLRFTASLNPPVAVSVTVNFAAPPGKTLCDPGAALIVKSGKVPRLK